MKVWPPFAFSYLANDTLVRYKRSNAPYNNMYSQYTNKPYIHEAVMSVLWQCGVGVLLVQWWVRCWRAVGAVASAVLACCWCSGQCSVQLCSYLALLVKVAAPRLADNYLVYLPPGLTTAARFSVPCPVPCPATIVPCPATIVPCPATIVPCLATIAPCTATIVPCPATIVACPATIVACSATSSR